MPEISLSGCLMASRLTEEHLLEKLLLGKLTSEGKQSQPISFSRKATPDKKNILKMKGGVPKKPWRVRIKTITSLNAAPDEEELTRR